MLEVVILVGVLLGLCLFFWRQASKATEEAAQVKEQKNVQDTALDDVARASHTRDLLRSDPDYAKWVRDKFSRD